MSPEPGSLWWCDGVALGFEPHFKRRPVLVVRGLEEGSVLVAPLSSRRRYGQEPAVRHADGDSYLTGALCVVAADALTRRIGRWDGFDTWFTAQERAAQAASRVGRFLRWLRGVTGNRRMF